MWRMMATGNKLGWNKYKRNASWFAIKVQSCVEYLTYWGFQKAGEQDLVKGWEGRRQMEELNFDFVTKHFMGNSQNYRRGVSGNKEMTSTSKDFIGQWVEMRFCKNGNSSDWTLQFRPSESPKILRAATVLMPHFVVLPRWDIKESSRHRKPTSTISMFFLQEFLAEEIVAASCLRQQHGKAAEQGLSLIVSHLHHPHSANGRGSPTTGSWIGKLNDISKAIMLLSVLLPQKCCH